MGRKAKEHPFTVVYVYAPEQYKKAYMLGKVIPNVKIGETVSDSNDCKTCMDAAMKRINQQSTGFKEYMYLLQWFVFPYKKGTDDCIREILTNSIYNKVSSKKIDNAKLKDQRTTKIGQEFAYNVSMSQINTAVSVYKLKTKMEELINDRGIDPTFKKRLAKLIDELVANLNNIANESAQTIYDLPFLEQNKIKYIEQYSEDIEPEF